MRSVGICARGVDSVTKYVNKFIAIITITIMIITQGVRCPTPQSATELSLSAYVVVSIDWAEKILYAIRLIMFRLFWNFCRSEECFAFMVVDTFVFGGNVWKGKYIYICIYISIFSVKQDIIVFKVIIFTIYLIFFSQLANLIISKPFLEEMLFYMCEVFMCFPLRFPITIEN